MFMSILHDQVQQNKQQLSAMKRKVGDAGVEELRPGEPPAKINSRWTNDELLMAVTGVKKYGNVLKLCLKLWAQHVSEGSLLGP